MYDKKMMRYLAIMPPVLVFMLMQTAIAAPPPLTYDPVNPVSLNEFAMQRVRDGDLGTALIMLERAALIAPYDPRIQANLHALRDLKAGKPLNIVSNPPAKEGEAAPLKTNTAEGTPVTSDAPAFPLWPGK